MEKRFRTLERRIRDMLMALTMTILRDMLGGGLRGLRPGPRAHADMMVMTIMVDEDVGNKDRGGGTLSGADPELMVITVVMMRARSGERGRRVVATLMTKVTKVANDSEDGRRQAIMTIKMRTIMTKTGLVPKLLRRLLASNAVTRLRLAFGWSQQPRWLVLFGTAWFLAFCASHAKTTAA